MTESQLKLYNLCRQENADNANIRGELPLEALSPIKAIENKEGIDLNDDFKCALKVMDETNKSQLVTGKAGTGKSTLLRHFVKNTKKNVVVCAPTGISALNVSGQTIHSLFRFPPKMLDYSDVKVSYNANYKSIDTIIIDEISMVRADIFDAIDLFMRLNGKDPGKPFGGVQMILFGDLYQLPPVVEKELGEILHSIYKSPYFFDANVMKYFSFDVINLTKVYRQTDVDFINFLDKVRLGNVDEVSLGFINSRVNPKPDDEFITLTPTNFVANIINRGKLSEISSKVHVYNAVITGDFKLEYPTDSELNLKIDAQVIFVKNDKYGRWVNGTLGKVIECKDGCVDVKINDRFTVEVGPEEWDKIKYEYNKDKRRVIANTSGRFIQIPLKLAWALTIHKSQSQTLDRIHLDLSSGVWEHGHTYVALSRCRTLNGISLKNKINLKDIKVDARITEFLESKLKNIIEKSRRVKK